MAVGSAKRALGLHRQKENWEGVGRGRRAENYSNKRKEIQPKYFSSVSAAVSEDSVKARIFALRSCTPCYLKNK